VQLIEKNGVLDVVRVDGVTVLQPPCLGGDG
jgi:hypothetical protein